MLRFRSWPWLVGYSFDRIKWGWKIVCVWRKLRRCHLSCFRSVICHFLAGRPIILAGRPLLWQGGLKLWEGGPPSQNLCVENTAYWLSAHYWFMWPEWDAGHELICKKKKSDLWWVSRSNGDCVVDPSGTIAPPKWLVSKTLWTVWRRLRYIWESSVPTFTALTCAYRLMWPEWDAGYELVCKRKKRSDLWRHTTYNTFL